MQQEITERTTPQGSQHFGLDPETAAALAQAGEEGRHVHYAMHTEDGAEWLLCVAIQVPENATVVRINDYLTCGNCRDANVRAAVRYYDWLKKKDLKGQDQAAA